MRNPLVSVIESLKAYRRIASLNESEIKQAVILRFLYILGWNIFNTDEVHPRDKFCGRTDYLLRINGIARVFIEVMKKGERPENYEKYRDYFLNGKDGFVILTNGVKWWFYFAPMHDAKKWEEELFYVIDILNQKSDDVASRIVDFLSKGNVISRNALTNAEASLDEEMQLRLKLLSRLIENIKTGVDEYADKSLANIKRDAKRISGFKSFAEILAQFSGADADRLRDGLIRRDEWNEIIKTEALLEKQEIYFLEENEAFEDLNLETVPTT